MRSTPSFRRKPQKLRIGWWISQHDEADVMQVRISEQGSKLDFSKPDLTEQEGCRVYGLLSDAAFEQSRDLQSTSKRMDENCGKGAALIAY